MSTTPLIVGGVFTLGAVDFSDAIVKVILGVDADKIEIPATLATPKTARRGGAEYSLQIDYLSNDASATTEMFRKLWDAITTGDGTLAFTLKNRNAAVSVNNPLWSGTVVTLAAHVGGQAEGLSQDSITLPLTGVPTPAFS